MPVIWLPRATDEDFGGHEGIYFGPHGKVWEAWCWPDKLIIAECVRIWGDFPDHVISCNSHYCILLNLREFSRIYDCMQGSRFLMISGSLASFSHSSRTVLTTDTLLHTLVWAHASLVLSYPKDRRRETEKKI